MLFKFCRVGRKNVDTLFINLSRHYARAAFNSRRDENKSIEDEVKFHKNKIPIIKCKKSMYDFYGDDTYTKKKPVLASHGWKNRNTKDDYFFIYPYDNKDTNAKREIGFETFEDFDLHPTVCDNLESIDIHKPLEIQRLGIPKILEGRNILLAAETGCGKTLAYLLPLITQVLKWKRIARRNVNCPLGLIVTPSRELTVQIALELIKMSKHLDIKTKLITGGRTKRIILNPPSSNVDILVCSFGVISKLTTFGVYDLKFVRYVVLDEADSLFHHTFEEKLKVFISRIPIGYCHDTSENEFPNTAQLVLTCATISSRLKELDNVLGNIPNSLEHVKTKKLHNVLIPQKFVRLIPSKKPVELLKFIKPKILNKQRVIVFCNHNSTSYWLSLFLHECGIKTTNLNGHMPLEIRRGQYGEFLNGKTMVLSTTNGGSRGLDTLMVNHILNYDFPLDTAAYIHRCGRTGRVGTTGECRVTNFISKKSEVVIVQKIEMAVRRKKPIPIFDLFESDEKMEEKEEAEGENVYIEKLIENIDEAENIPY